MDIRTLRVGTGFDAHAFLEGRKLVIGGVHFEGETGLAGHSDADVLIHAIIDALLGAAGLGDIGKLFPDSSHEFKDIASSVLLERVALLLKENNIEIINVDSVVICERPKLSPRTDEMKQRIAGILGIDTSRIGIKGKTTEKLGFTGRGEGIAVQTTALVYLG